MSPSISRRECVFLAPLDTALQQTSSLFDPLLRFFALFNRHIVVTDSQLLDNRIFREKTLSQNMELIFHEDSGDGLPLFLVSQRTAERSLAEILVVDLGGSEVRPPKMPMTFSSFTREQQQRLESLHRKGKITLRSFALEIEYPVDWLQRISRLLKRAGYAEQLVWPRKIEDRGRYHKLLVRTLQCRSLAQQAGISHPATKAFLKRLIERIGQCDPQEFSRTIVYSKLDAAQRELAGEKRRWAVRRDDIAKAFAAVRSMTAYAYLRNFSDASRFTLLLDHTHWLPSSVVNRELRRSRPQAESADRLVEKWLDLHEGAFEGFGASRHLAMSRLLKACGFADRASWEAILHLRRDPAFGERLTGIACSKMGEEASERRRDHARICLEQLLGRAKWKDLVLQGITMSTPGALSEVVRGTITGSWTATGFAVPTAVAALVVGWKGLKSMAQPILIDRLGTTVADELRKLPPAPG